MPAIVAASIAFALIFGCTLFGMFMRTRVPDVHLAEDSKDVIRLAMVLIVTMSAVVLALLFASTRASYEQTSATVLRPILFAQPADSISRPFMTAPILWPAFIFGSFAVSAPPDRTIVMVVFICVLSASSAIFLILELGQPFDGLMQLPNAGLRDALSPLLATR